MPFLRDRRNVSIQHLGINAGAGMLRGIGSEFKFGTNPDVGSADETIWAYGGLYSYPLIAAIMTLSSSNTNDYATGTGAQSVRIYGLDANYNEVTEDLTLHATDGLLGVNTILSYLRVFRIYVLTAGSADTAAGNLYMGTGAIVAGEPTNVYGMAPLGHNQTLQTVYTIPAGKTGYILRWNMSVNSGKIADVDLKIRAPGEVFATKMSVNIYQTAYTQEFSLPFPLPEKVDLEMRASVASSGGDVSASYEILLVDNDLILKNL